MWDRYSTLIVLPMKRYYNLLLRIIPTFIVGLFMVVFPQKALHYIALALGLVLLIPGVIKLIQYIIIRTQRSRRSRRNSKMTFPFMATFCTLSGIAILAYPSVVAKIFIYLLGAIIVFAGGYEILFLRLSKRNIPYGYYILPIFQLLIGLFILLNPLNVTERLIVTVFGIGAILYSLSEIICTLRFRR